MTVDQIDALAIAEEALQYLERQYPDLQVGIITAHPAQKLAGSVIMLSLQLRQRPLMEVTEGARRDSDAEHAIPSATADPRGEEGGRSG